MERFWAALFIFSPNPAAFAAAGILLAVLGLIFRMMRQGHHLLMSEAGEALLEGRKGAQGTEGGAGAWDGYPRPQMRRESFFPLNGTWLLDGKEIQVPFPPQSILSGYRGRVGAKMEYSRSFVLPADFFSAREKGGRILLHFGAVDQVAEVFLNGCRAGKHEGGYLPFWFDVTGYVREGENRLSVKAEDTLSALYPYGKQRKARGGMWYTPVSGIWQSVWMERVPEVHIERLDVRAGLRKVRVSVVSGGAEGEDRGKGIAADRREGGAAGYMSGRGENQESDGRKGGISVTVKLHDGTCHTVQAEGESVEIDLASIRLPDGSAYQPVLWTPERPYLYEMTVSLGADTVSSYFGLRTVETRQVDGVPRVCLNGEPVFLHGVLDQGYFCDGIYLPAGQEEYERDVLRMKELGFNLLRKHIKIEPECFYYYCDVHGMLVMQDMVNSGRYSWLRDTALPTIGLYRKAPGRLGSRRRKAFFREHMRETIQQLGNHPCVVAYTIFNEGWGQFEADAMYREAKELDGTRLYDAASGWFPGKESDFDSQHIYFRSLSVPERPVLPVLISECGGYSCRVAGHFYAKYARYGYGECRDGRELAERIGRLYGETVLPAVPKGVCGCIYTQLSDVEDETNGLYTYDRKACKVDKEAMCRLSRQLAAAVLR